MFITEREKFLTEVLCMHNCVAADSEMASCAHRMYDKRYYFGCSAIRLSYLYYTEYVCVSIMTRRIRHGREAKIYLFLCTEIHTSAENTMNFGFRHSISKYVKLRPWFTSPVECGERAHFAIFMGKCVSSHVDMFNVRKLNAMRLQKIKYKWKNIFFFFWHLTLAALQLDDRCMWLSNRSLNGVFSNHLRNGRKLWQMHRNFVSILPFFNVIVIADGTNQLASNVICFMHEMMLIKVNVRTDNDKVRRLRMALFSTGSWTNNIVDPVIGHTFFNVITEALYFPKLKEKKHNMMYSVHETRHVVIEYFGIR